MSVETEADKLLSLAHAEVSKALKKVNSVIMDDVWGAGEFNASANDKIRKAHALLLETRDLLDVFK